MHECLAVNNVLFAICYLLFVICLSRLAAIVDDTKNALGMEHVQRARLPGRGLGGKQVRDGSDLMNKPNWLLFSRVLMSVFVFAFAFERFKWMRRRTARCTSIGSDGRRGE